MPKILRHFIHGVGGAICVFPSRREVCEPPVTGDYFKNVGAHLQRSIEVQAPAIRRDANQMELSLEPALAEKE